MKVDLHFHLEEGPYSTDWLTRTMRALTATHQGERLERHSRAWAEQLANELANRVNNGCFSEEWLDRYLTKGRERGIGVFGVVDHLYRFRECRPYYEKHMLLDNSPLGTMQRQWLDKVCVHSIDEFVDFVTEAKKSRKDLLLGIEADYFLDGEEELGQLLSGYNWDYVIGSVHFLDGWGFDNPEAKERFEGLSPLDTYRQYYDVMGRACDSGLFNFIAHPDNLKVFGFRPDNEADLLPLYREFAAKLINKGVGSEINTGLAYRYPVAESCPSPLLLSVFAEYGVPLTQSSDSHFPDDIGTMLEEARTDALAAGYTEWTIYEGRRSRKVSIQD